MRLLPKNYPKTAKLRGEGGIFGKKRDHILCTNATLNTKYGSLVEETGFEPTTSWSRTKRATKLRYSSKKFRIPCVDPELVEVTGLEPTTSWSLTKRATKLRYTSMKAFLII